MCVFVIVFLVRDGLEILGLENIIMNLLYFLVGESWEKKVYRFWRERIGLFFDYIDIVFFCSDLFFILDYIIFRVNKNCLKVFFFGCRKRFNCDFLEGR